MMYKAKSAVCSEIRTNSQRKVTTMWNFWLLSLVVRKGRTRLWNVKYERSWMPRMQKRKRICLMMSLVGLYVATVMWQMCQLLSVSVHCAKNEFLTKHDTKSFHSQLHTPPHTFRDTSVSCRKFHKVAMSISGCKVTANSFLPQNKLDPL
jgi:hypothetical protein